MGNVAVVGGSYHLLAMIFVLHTVTVGYAVALAIVELAVVDFLPCGSSWPPLSLLQLTWYPCFVQHCSSIWPVLLPYQ